MQVKARFSLWKEIAWGPAMALAAIPWFLLGAFDLVKAEFLSSDLQSKWQFAKINPWPWWAWVLMSLAIMIIVVLEGAFRVVKKHESALKAEIAQRDKHIQDLVGVISGKDREIDELKETPDLVALAPPEEQSQIRLQARGLTHIQWDYTAKMHTHLYDGSGNGFSIVIQLVNLAVRGASNEAVRVRAQAKFKCEDETTLLSPLAWIDSPTSDVVIGPGEIRELVIARRGPYNFWDFVTHGPHGNISPRDGIDFDLEIDLIGLDDGKILDVKPPLYFHWHWREGPLTPNFHQVEPPKEEKEHGRAEGA